MSSWLNFLSGYLGTLVMMQNLYFHLLGILSSIYIPFMVLKQLESKAVLGFNGLMLIVNAHSCLCLHCLRFHCSFLITNVSILCTCKCYLFAFLTSAPGDYSSVTVDMTFDGVSNSSCARIAIMDDDSLEGVESFNIKIVLDTAAPNNSAVLLRPDTTTVYISDNDGKWNNFWVRTQ